MKTIRNILTTLLVILILLIIVGLFLPADRHFETKVIIKAPAYIVFDHANNLKNWEKWSPWTVRDTQIKLEYEGPSSGKGSVCKWTLLNRQTGSGSLKIIESRPYELILIEINFLKQGKMLWLWTFENTGEETIVIWGLDIKNMNIAERYFSLFVHDMMESYFKKGLDNLKSVSEKISGKPSLIEEMEFKSLSGIADSLIFDNDKGILLNKL